IGFMARDPKIPAQNDTKGQPAKAPGGSEIASSTHADIADFLNQVKALAPGANEAAGRLIFALDATMSRQPTWDMACALQADMFKEAGAIGGLAMRLIYYRGLAECRATAWISDPQKLSTLMSGIQCRGGHTQIGKIL